MKKKISTWLLAGCISLQLLAGCNAPAPGSSTSTGTPVAANSPFQAVAVETAGLMLQEYGVDSIQYALVENGKLIMSDQHGASTAPVFGIA